MTEKWLFGIKVVIHTSHGAKTFIHSNSDKRNLEIHFSIPFSSDTEKNVAELSIYNMAKSNYNAIKQGNKCTIYAGYGGKLGLVFHGVIFRKSVPTKTDADVLYKFKLLEGKDYAKLKKIKVAFKKKTTAKTIINTVCRKSGIKLHQVSLKTNKVYKKGYSANDHPLNVLSEIAQDCKTSLFYNRGQLTLRYVFDGKGRHTVSLTPTNGLVGSPSNESRDDDWVDADDNDGMGKWSWSAESIFNYNITTFARVHIKTSLINHTVVVSSGKHSFDGTSPRTTFEAVTK